MSHTAKLLQIIILVDQLSSKQLFELGQHIKSLPTPPKITLVKMVPIFPVRFYQLPEAKAAETKSLYNASLELSKAMQDLGLPATRKIVRGSNPSVLRQLFPDCVDTLIIGKKTCLGEMSFLPNHKQLIIDFESSRLFCS